MAETRVKKTRRFSFKSIGRFFKEVVAELKRVSWPAKKELWIYTLAVVIFVVIMASLIGLADVLFAQGLSLVVGGSGS